MATSSFQSTKFGRNYYLQVSTTNSIPGSLTNAVPYVAPQLDFLPISLPLTVTFDITRDFLSSANRCMVRVYNLSTTSRNLIRKNELDLNNFRTIQFYAGYNQNIPLVFSGQIFKSFYVREGVDYISEIQCMDGGLAFQQSNFSSVVSEEESQQQLLNRLVNSLTAYGISPGKISQIASTPRSRSNSYEGNTIDQINNIAEQCFFIDNGVAHLLTATDCLKGTLTKIDLDSGLLNTPQREGTRIVFDMLFEPRLIVGQYVLLKSQTNSNFNGSYKVIALSHRGMISPTVCGEAITSVTLLSGIGDLNVF